jgi:hypothetical protein
LSEFAIFNRKLTKKGGGKGIKIDILRNKIETYGVKCDSCDIKSCFWGRIFIYKLKIEKIHEKK